MGRKALFNKTRGVAVTLLQRAFELPPCNGLLPGKLMLQNLPSIVAAQALSPTRGSRVLDMCAAPGGECTAPAQWAILGGCMWCIAVTWLLGGRQVAAGVQCSQEPAGQAGIHPTHAVLDLCAPNASQKPAVDQLLFKQDEMERKSASAANISQGTLVALFHAVRLPTSLATAGLLPF